MKNETARSPPSEGMSKGVVRVTRSAPVALASGDSATALMPHAYIAARAFGQTPTSAHLARGCTRLHRTLDLNVRAVYPIAMLTMIETAHVRVQCDSCG